MLINDELEFGGLHKISVVNFPKKNMDSVFHVRPHDNNTQVAKVILPNGKYTINYCLWLNNDYIERKLKEKGIINDI